MELIPIGVMGLEDAKNFQKKLKDQGIEIALNHDDASCTRGCAVTVELRAREQDLPQIQQVFSEEYKKTLDGHDVNFEQMGAVFDPQASEVTCPACGHRFKPTGSECPDCGLMF